MRIACLCVCALRNRVRTRAIAFFSRFPFFILPTENYRFSHTHTQPSTPHPPRQDRETRCSIELPTYHWTKTSKSPGWRLTYWDIPIEFSRPNKSVSTNFIIHRSFYDELVFCPRTYLRVSTNIPVTKPPFIRHYLRIFPVVVIRKSHSYSFANRTDVSIPFAYYLRTQIVLQDIYYWTP